MKYPASLMPVLFLMGCSHSPGARLLDEVDSLIAAEEYDSAYHVIMDMDTLFDKGADRARYNLLLTRTGYLTDNTPQSDSAIDAAIGYYRRSGDAERLADSYYYKASCLNERGNALQAAKYYKMAEETAAESNSPSLKYKIAESMTKLNNKGGNYDLQLAYARKALGHALESGNRNYIAYSYFNLGMAFQYLDEPDSMTKYTKELIPRLGDIYREDLTHFLGSIGFMYYKNGDMANARKYYEQALEQRLVPRTMANLADVYVSEGDEEKAYELWQKAFLIGGDCTGNVDDGSTRHVVMFNMLQYDLQHNKNLEDACQRMYRIYEIRDSMANTFKDRRMMELQQKYDEAAMSHAYEGRIMRWTVATLILSVAMLAVWGHARYKRYRSCLLVARQQMLIGHYSSKIDRLASECRFAEESIGRYESLMADYTRQVERLKASGDSSQKLVAELDRQLQEHADRNKELEDSCAAAGRQIESMRQMIAELVEKSSPMLNRGHLLYDEILGGGTATGWRKDDYICFVEFYKAVHFKEFAAIERQYGNLTVRNQFFLILGEMGLDGKAIGNIMGVSQESIRTTRHRLQKKRRET